MSSNEYLQAERISNQNHIGLQKAILWEEAKGKLRAMAAAGGQINSSYLRSPDWKGVKQSVEDFIHAFESEGLHE